MQLESACSDVEHALWPNADNVTVVVIDLGGGKDGWAKGKGKGGGMTGGWNPFGN